MPRSIPALAALLTLASVAHALPEDPGPHDVDTLTRTESIAGVAVPFDLYLPKGLSTPAPVVVVGHGFQRTKANMAEWGEELARRGYVAAVPSFPGADHPLNGKILTGLLAWIEAEAAEPASPLSGVVDGSRSAAMGFSAGGLAALLAAASDSAIDLVVGLDPVDNGEQGIKAAPSIQAPVVFVRAEPSQCNSNGNGGAVFAKLTGPRLSLMVVGATHCDGEAPSGPLCAVLCGAQVQARHLLFRRYAFASLDYLLRCETAMAPWLGGAQAQADTGIKDLTASAFPPPPGGCTALPDAGPPADAVLDRGTALDQGELLDTASGDGPTGPADEGDGGCSCGAAGAPRESLVWMGVGLLLLLWRGRRSIT